MSLTSNIKKFIHLDASNYSTDPTMPTPITLAGEYVIMLENIQAVSYFGPTNLTTGQIFTFIFNSAALGVDHICLARNYVLNMDTNTWVPQDATTDNFQIYSGGGTFNFLQTDSTTALIEAI